MNLKSLKARIALLFIINFVLEKIVSFERLEKPEIKSTTTVAIKVLFKSVLYILACCNAEEVHANFI